jgi:CelD/BcsL family acetyltransferase involved in cellulose biosynthesis
MCSALEAGAHRRTGHMTDLVEWITRLVWDLFERRSDGCAGNLSVLRCEDRVVAVHFGLLV